MKQLQVACRFCGVKVIDKCSSSSQVDNWFQDERGYCCEYCHNIYIIATAAIAEQIQPERLNPEKPRKEAKR